MAEPTAARASSARLMALGEALAYLGSPDTGLPLRLDDGGQSLSTADGAERFPVRGILPMLFSQRFQPFIGDNTLEIPVRCYDDAVLQYGLLSAIKHQQGFPNSPHDSPWYHQHIDHVRRLVRHAKGSLLDIGCDSPPISAGMFPRGVNYLGLDPLFSNKADFRLIGMAEFLPVRAGVFDNVCLISSLDHILDHHRAIDQAYRVLKPGGWLYFQILVWHDRAEVMYDHFHFHHFREFEILGALSRFRIEVLERQGWKGDTHRTSLYIAATKPA